jgi:hypothetical protein
MAARLLRVVLEAAGDLAAMSNSRLGRIFQLRADRLAAAWRRLHAADNDGHPSDPRLLDGLIEPFIAALGRSLCQPGQPPWSATSGVLRLSAARGTAALYAEFAALRRCLGDAVSAVGASIAERAQVSRELDEALACAIHLARRLEDPGLPPPLPPFGGVVVEVFERPRAARADPAAPRVAH